MNEEIMNYAIVSFGEDVAYLIENLFHHFDDFGLPEYETEFYNILMTDNTVDISTTHDDFYNLVVDCTDRIFINHGIVLKPETRLRDRNELLDSLKVVQNLIDYSEIYLHLESDEDDLEKFALIVESTSMLRRTDVYDIIEELDSELVKTIRFLVLKQIENEDTGNIGYDNLKYKIIDNARKFESFLNGKVSCGIQLMNQGLLLGEEFSTYVPYIEGYLQEMDERGIAETIYSVIILSSDGYVNPILTFKKNIELIPINPDRQYKIEQEFANFASEFESYRRGTTRYK